MPWKCPACQEAIQHRPYEDKPRVGVHYRCPICRLDLVLDPATDQLILPPIEEGGARPPRKRAVGRGR